jgi:membrane-bound hydrogenase subunit beta
MKEDDDILAELSGKFPYLEGKMRIQRARRIYVDVPADKFAEVFAHIHGPMKFVILTAITGLDAGVNLSAIYHLARTSGVLLNLYRSVPKSDPVIQTVSNFFPAADIYERELVDMLGMKVEGLAEGSRYPLPDGWPEGQYPLRKDWTPAMLEGAAPVGAAALVPSKAAENSIPATETKNG